MKKIISLLSFFICFLITFSVFAKADDSKNNLDSFFKPEIFSLSKKKENAFDAPSATYVLSSEEIRRSGATSIPEALRLIPGLQVARIDGNKWAITARGFNRQFSNKLLVMIDGRIVYTPLFSGVAWDIHDYVMEDIDRIEVVRGPGGSIWGTNAVNGVVNIITKSALQTQGSYVSQIVGTADKSITEARYGGETNDKDHYRLYVKNALRDGVNRYSTKTSSEDGNRQTRAGFRYDKNSIKDNSITVHGDIFQGKAENFFFFNSPIPNNPNNKDSDGANLVFNWDKKISKLSNITLTSYYDYDHFNIPVLEKSVKIFDVDFQHFYSFSKDNRFIWGLGYRQNISKSKETNLVGYIPLDYTPNRRNEELWSAFIQDKFALISDELYLTVGSKFSINDLTGFEYQPNTRLAYYPSRNQTIWASISKAVRTPTEGEDGLEIKAQNTATINKGSNAYDSEELLAYEIGYRIKPTHGTLIDATAFYNDYSKLRTFESTGPNGANPTVANLGYGESYGFEITGKWQVTNDWKLEANYDYFTMDLHVSSVSTDSPNSSNPSLVSSSDGLQVAEGVSPKNQFKLKSFYNLTSKIEFDNILYYVDNLPMAGSNYRTTGLPSYFRFDTRIGYLPSRNLDFSVGIQNLLDQRHTEFKPALYNRRTEVGRTFYVKIVWQY